MVRSAAPLGLALDPTYHITWLTPEAARQSGARVGMRAGASRGLPWAVTRRYLEALERCFDSGIAVAWYEPGVDGRFRSIGQAFPLPLGRGLLVAGVRLDLPVPGDLGLSVVSGPRVAVPVAVNGDGAQLFDAIIDRRLDP